MKQFHFNFGGKDVRITFNERRGTVALVEEDGKAFVPNAERMPIYAGVIALALAQYEIEEVHDNETEIIAVKPHSTSWNNPVRQFNHKA